MLPFLRKYQKVLFGLVAFVVILSFSVFGVSSAFFDRSFEKEKFVTGKNGASIKESDIKVLSYLLATHPFSNPPNFVEDSFIEETLLQTGILSFLLEKSASFSETFWQEKKERVQNFSLYKHPKFSFLDVEAIWKEKAPGLWEAFCNLKKEFSKENYIKLFWEETKYPGLKTKQAIWAKMQKSPSLYQDPAFFEKEFALFGFSGIREWFSPTFVEEMAQFILESAFSAQKEGIALSRQEGKQEIIRSLQKKFPSEKGEAVFQKQLQLLGIPETLFLSVWEKVLIFQKWLDKAALLSEKNYTPKEGKKPIKAVKIRLVSIKPEIQGKNPLDTLASERYFETVLKDFSKEKEPLFSSAEEIQKKAPELVYETYSIRWAETTPKLASLQIPTKKMMQWLLVEENKKSIAKKFPEISSEEKASFLQNVSPEKRKEIEGYVREQMVLQEKDWAKAFLKNQKNKAKSFL